MSRVSRTWLAGVLLAGSLTSPAVAQEDGVFVDPDSPTGKEYAIPLESVRRQADPSTGQSGSGAPETAPPFGSGIVGDGAQPQSGSGEPGDDTSGGGTDPRADSDDRRSGSDDRRSGSGGIDTNPEATEMREGRSSVAAATSNPGAPSGGLGTVATIGLLSAGALLIGGLGGVVLRRVRG